MWAGALAATIADTIPAPLAATIAGPLSGIVAHAVAILVNRVRPGALVLSGALSSVVTHTVAICINILAGALTLTRPLALLGKDGRRSGNQRDERKCQDKCYAPCSCMHDTISLFILLACSHFSKPSMFVWLEYSNTVWRTDGGQPQSVWKIARYALRSTGRSTSTR
jgi:hypothetical protein